MKSVSLLLALALSLQGCAMMAPPSRARVILNESTVTEHGDLYTFELEFSTKGDTESGMQQLVYNGEGENPWKLVLGQDVQGMTSPATLAGVQGVTAALPALIGTLGLLLMPIPDMPPAADGTVPTFLDLLLRATKKVPVK